MSGFGWKPEGYNPDDKPYRSALNGTIKDSVDLSKDHPEWLEAIFDQVHTSSCVANATAAAYRFAAHKQNAEATDDPLRMVEPSRLFIYYNARIIPEMEKGQLPIDANDVPKNSTDNGSFIRNAFKGMKLFGVCGENRWPWNNIEVTLSNGTKVEQPVHLNDAPPNNIYSEASTSVVVECCRLDPDHPDQIEKDMMAEERLAVGIITLMRLKQCLSEGYPVVLGFWFYGEPGKAFVKIGNENVLKAVPQTLRHTLFEKHGGHAVLCIGYDNSRDQVLCQNSWGTNKSYNGRFWMPYSYITDWEATDDFWMMRAIKQTPWNVGENTEDSTFTGISDTDRLVNPDHFKNR